MGQIIEYMNLNILEDLGLSNAEVKIYIALLELGQSKTGNIIDKTKLQSSTVYHVLGSLLEKGLVNYIMIGKIKYYQAESPENLLGFLDEKKKKLNLILPELKRKEKLRNVKQTAKVFEGIKGLQAAYADILKTMKKGEEYYFFQFPYEKLKNEKLILFFQNYHLKRAEKGINVRGISGREGKSILRKIYSVPNTHIRYLDEPSPTVVVIYKNKILMIDWDDKPVAFIIESNAIYKSYKKFFLSKWKLAKSK